MTDFGQPLPAVPMKVDFTCANSGKLVINAAKNSWIVPYNRGFGTTPARLFYREVSQGLFRRYQ
jgi:hypothetical protein